MACSPCFPYEPAAASIAPLRPCASPACPRPPPCNVQPRLTNLAPQPSLTAVTAAQLHLSHLALLTSFPPRPSGFCLALPHSSLPPATSAVFSSSSPSCASSASFCPPTPALPGHAAPSLSRPPLRRLARLVSSVPFRPCSSRRICTASVNPASYTLCGKGKREAGCEFRGKGGEAALRRSCAACFSVGLWFARALPRCGRCPRDPLSPWHFQRRGRSCARDRFPECTCADSWSAASYRTVRCPGTRLPRTTCDHRESTADDTPPAAADTSPCVHLPQLVWLGALEPLGRRTVRVFLYQPAPFQNAVNRPHRRRYSLFLFAASRVTSSRPVA